MEKENKNKEMEGVTVYEVGYTLLPSLAVEQVPARVESLKEMISKAGGAVISNENPILIDLAYPMTKVIQTTRHKCTTGYFGWIKFELTAEGIEGVKKSLDADNTILRYLITKTVKENTLVNGKMMLRKEEEAPEEVEEEVVADIVPPEELDKSIDNLVIA